jgi:hypothetical protein
MNNRVHYEIRSGGRSVSFSDASTAQEAVMDYVRSLGCRDDEVRRVAIDAVTWRGAVFSAVVAESDELLSRNAA